MKKFLSLVILTFVYSSCTNPEIEKDAKRVEELTCRSQKLIAQSKNSDFNSDEYPQLVEESQKISTEAQNLLSEMQGKYLADSEQEQFFQAYTDELEKCK